MDNTQVIKIDFQAIPLPIESKHNSNDKPVSWGSNNEYPLFLLGLYGKSPIHANVIDQKAVHIFGDGLFDKSTDKPFALKPNADDTFELFLDKLVKSLLMFNAFAVEINFLPDGKPAHFYHLPIDRIGLNKAKDRVFYYGEDNRSKVTASFDRYDPNIVYTDHKSKVFYYEGYKPSNASTYPTPDYYQLIKSILTDIAITDFNYNQISNHFSPSTILTFFKGEQDVETQAKIVKDLKASYTGTDGKKLLVDFVNPGASAKGVEVQQLSSGDWTDAYIALKEATEATIYKGHGITSPALFGDKTEGQLGSSQELENAYEIWNNSYLRVKRNELEATLKELFGVTVYFKNKPLFSTSLSEELKKAIMTINELRKEQGLAPLANGDRIIGESAPEPTQFKSACTHFNDEKGKVLTEEDYELVKDLGLSAEEYEEVDGDSFSAQLQFDDEADIANWILNNEVESVSQIRSAIRKDLGIEMTSGGVKDLLNKLHETGIANVSITDDKVALKPTPKSNKPYTSKEVLAMFKYQKRPEVDGEELLETSRGFCVKLIESGKLYSRADIQAMSALFGYDVQKHTGGFYYNPNTGETTNYCRHEWKQVSVVKKEGK